MPEISRWFIKAGLVYFVVGIVLATLAEFPGFSKGALLLPVYWHMIVLGWITQIIMGVSIWMFPRRNRKRDLIETWKARAAFWLLNGGLILRFGSEPFLPLVQNPGLITISIVLSSLMQTAAIVFYIAEIWPRVFSRKPVARRKK